MHMHTHDGWFPELVLLYSEAGQATTFHVDCEPWWQPNAVLIGDAAHAYGPLTAKMANLAMNDAHSLATMLNGPNVYDLSQEQILKKWQSVQRPKFEVTRIRTLRHLQLYTPTVRAIVKFLWKFCPQFTSRYFQSIFSYDYDIMTKEGHTQHDMGIAGIKDADPLIAYTKKCIYDISYYIGMTILIFFLFVGFN